MRSSSLLDAPASPAQPPLVLRLDRGPRRQPGGSGFPRRNARGWRIADLSVGLILLAITLPVLALAALAIRLESPGPVIRRRPHIGQGGQVFDLLTFRSTRAPASPQEATTESDALTRVGRLIRLPRVDQLPILFNLLRGDMTLIGPAPRPHNVALPRAVAPLAQPGVTGWVAQD